MVQHSVRFTKIASEARAKITECQVKDVKKRLDQGDAFVLIDCREESEWREGHLPKAIHVGKGVIERDIDKAVPGVDTEIVIYCGGGYRSALAAENLQRMGYRNVISMDGGIRGWREAGFPIVKD